MGKIQNVIREGVAFGKHEVILSVVVFAYLVISYSVLSSLKVLNETYLMLLQVFFILVENYITVCVYLGLKKSLWRDTFSPGRLFMEGNHFFGRVLLYKAAVGFLTLLILGFAHGMIEFLQNVSVVKTVFMMGVTIIWLAFPVFILILSLFTPLIIIVEDIPLVSAVRKSVYFFKKFLSQILLLVVVLLPLWIFAFFLLMVYNEITEMLKWGMFYFLALLEIATIRIFLVFYRDNMSFQKPIGDGK